MPVTKESTREFNNYLKVQFVEFLEVIARVAEARYIETTGLGLDKKIEFILDELFKVVGVQRKEVGQD
jgi:hypothetical protein